jgi:hypothetical protein
MVSDTAASEVMETMIGAALAGTGAATGSAGSGAAVSTAAGLEISAASTVSGAFGASWGSGAAGGECLLIRFITWAVLLVSAVFLLAAIKTLL